MPKAQTTSSHHSALLIIALLAAVLLASRAQGQSLYWDTNGSTVGAGSTAPAGLWDLSALRWNNAAGDGTATGWGNTGLETAFFAAGSDATGAYEVTLGAGAALKLSAVSVGAGSLTLSPQTDVDGLDFGTANAALHVAAGASLTIASFVSGSAGLTKGGTGTVLLSGSTLPTGAYVVQAGELQIADGVNVNAGALTLGGSAGVGATLTLGTTAVFNLGGTLTYSNAGTPLAAVIQGGTMKLNGSRAFTIQNVAADPDLTITSVIADGSVSSDLIKGGGGSLLLTGANTYSGVTTISGALHVQGNSASIAGSSAMNIGAGAVANIGAAADSVVVNRLGDSAAITLTGGAAGAATLNYIGANTATQIVHAEKTGALTIAGDHRSVVTLTPGSGDELVVTFDSLARGDHAVGVVRASNLSVAEGTADSTRVFFTTAPTLTGGIIPWLLGDASTTGSGTGFVTYASSSGLRLLSGGDYATPAAATSGANVLKSATGAQAVNTSVVVNSWTTSNTGTTTLGANVTVGVTSGAMLFTATSTITGGTLDLAGTSDGIVHLSAGAAVTATINSAITGDKGLTLSGAGTGNKILVLGGTNTITGGVRVYGGILQLNSAGALNASGMNVLTVQTGTVRLNGQQATVAGLSGDGAVVNNSATVASTLRVNGTGTFTGTLNNGAAATLSLTKAGNGVLSLQGNNQLTGAVLVEQGVLQVGGGNNGGRLSGTTAVTILQGATLRLTSTNGNNVHADRLNDGATITLAGGTFDFNNSAAGSTDYSETAGAVTVTAGANQINADQAAAGRTSTLTFTSVTRERGATLNFAGGGSGLGASTRSRLEVGGLSEGFIGGWATVGGEFAKYVADIDTATAGNQGSIAAFTTADYSTLAQDNWTNALHVKQMADQTLNGSREVASVNLTAGMDIALGTNTLTITSGGLIKQGGAVGNNAAANRSQITNGTVTAGSIADAELLVRVNGANLNILATISDNAAGAVHVVKSGTGTLLLGGANTYTGNTYLNEGTLTVGSSGTGVSATQAGTVGRTGNGLTTVVGTAVLSGSGLVQGSLLLNGGTLRPGDSAGDARGTLWVGGDLTFTSGSVALQVTTATLNVAALADKADSGYATALADLVSNVALSNAIALTQHDHIDVGGTFDWGTGAGLVSVLNSGYTPVAGDVFNLLDWAQATNAGSVNVDSALALFDLGAGLSWDTSLWATQGLLIVSTPEPSRALLLLAGLAAVMQRRRRTL